MMHSIIQNTNSVRMVLYEKYARTELMLEYQICYSNLKLPEYDP